MRRVLADHNVPAPLVRLLKAFDIRMAADLGWADIKNGQLLAAAEDAGFEVLLSSDKTIKYEQNMTGRKIGMVSMSDNHWPGVGAYTAAISEAVKAVKPGEVLPVFCGRFVPKKYLREPEP